MKIEEKSIRHVLLRQLLALTASSNASLFRQAIGLGVIKEGDLELKSFHYHVRKLKLRDNALDHLKRKGMAPEDRQLPLAGCRLYSSPRLNFSVRLMIFAYEAEPDERARLSYGVLAVAQELCSGLMRAEVLASGRKSPADLCDIELEQVINFVAKSITLPRLKIASVHFPEIRYRPLDQVKPQGLIPAWLGYEQAPSIRSQMEREFMHFSQACIVKGDWRGLGHKLRPELGAFAADFPASRETSPDFPTVTASDGLDLTRPCGKPWRLRTVVKQLNRRLDQWNLKPTGVELSPALRICLARQRYSKLGRVDEQVQQLAIRALYKDVLYQKLTDNDDDDRLTHLVKHGIDHLNNRVHQIFK